MKIKPSRKALFLAFAALTVVIGTGALFAFPSHGGATVWKGYRVLSVPKSVPEAAVSGRLDSAGIHKYVTESNSLLVPNSPEAPILPFLAEANARRSRWFSSEDSDSRLLYLEDLSALDMRAVKAFREADFSWNLETGGGSNPIAPLCTVFFALTVVILSKKKAQNALICLPFILFSLNCDRISGIICAIVAISSAVSLARFLIPDFMIFTPHQIAHRFRANPLLFLFPIVPLLVGLIGGPTQTIMLAVTGFISVALLILTQYIPENYRNILRKKRLHPAFRPVAITGSAGQVKIDIRFLLRLTIPAAIALTAGITLTVMAAPSTNEKYSKELYLPVPSGYTHARGFGVEGFTELEGNKNPDGIPDLADFVGIAWNMRAYPWKKIREPLVTPKQGDTLERVRYSADDSGVITAASETFATFNDEFIRKALNDDGTPLERMLMRQGRFVSVDLKRLVK
ncbi:MAG TPA: hypothetical protein PKO22_04070 [Treponemataceae bacterium]|nr:hypothetical protein [Treponemataceae bacterium]